ncbi:MAG: hypothetical protein EHM72_20045 [Calditrichaeota bacterium]|nr:MAG: hypothetical protein EHM72_20045 [Calditrichota bacterium]
MTMKMNRSLLLFFVLITVSSAFAGKYGGDFMRIGVGARSAGFGGAFVAVVQDPTSFYWNPAGLAGISRFAVHVDHMALFNGLSQYNTAAAALCVGRGMTIGLSWIRLGVDEIPRYAPLSGTKLERLTTGINRSDGQSLGFFADAEDALLLSIAKKIHFELGLGPASNMIVFPVELAFGVNGKFIHHQLDGQTGVGQGLDVGIMARAVSRQQERGQAKHWLGAGVTVRDLSRTSISWNTASKHQDQVDAVYQAGLAFSTFFQGIKSRLTMAVDQELGELYATHAGIELELFHVAALRLGTTGKSVSAGAGLQFRSFRIDYAFVTHELDNSHRVSGAFELGR